MAERRRVLPSSLRDAMRGRGFGPAVFDSGRDTTRPATIRPGQFLRRTSPAQGAVQVGTRGGRQGVITPGTIAVQQAASRRAAEHGGIAPFNPGAASSRFGFGDILPDSPSDLLPSFDIPSSPGDIPIFPIGPFGPGVGPTIGDVFGGGAGFGGGTGDLRRGLFGAQAALTQGANLMSQAEINALNNAFAFQFQAQQQAFPHQQRALQQRLAELRNAQARISNTLGPSARIGAQSLRALHNLGQQQTQLSAGQTFDPNQFAAPLTFGVDPQSGMAFDPNLQAVDPFASSIQGRQLEAVDPFEFTGRDLAQDPGFQFRLQQGQEALDRSAAARGGLVSGRSLEAAQEFGQGLASTEFDRAFQRQAQTFGINATERQRQADEAQRVFGREAQTFGLNAAERQQQFGREAATFGLNAQEFGANFAREAQSFGLNQAANRESFQRQFQSFLANEDNTLRRDVLRLRDVNQRMSALGASANIGGSARNLLAQLDASMSHNISNAVAAPAMNQSANILRQAELRTRRIMGQGMSEANRFAAIANAQAQAQAAIGLAEANAAAQFSNQLFSILGIAGGAFLGGPGGAFLGGQLFGPSGGGIPQPGAIPFAAPGGLFGTPGGMFGRPGPQGTMEGILGPSFRPGAP